jgi:hypothetical protein
MRVEQYSTLCCKFPTISGQRGSINALNGILKDRDITAKLSK